LKTTSARITWPTGETLFASKRTSHPSEDAIVAYAGPHNKISSFQVRCDSNFMVKFFPVLTTEAGAKCTVTFDGQWQIDGEAQPL